MNLVSFPVAVMGVVNAVLALLLAFGVNVTEAQTAAIVGAVNALLVLAGFLWDMRTKKNAAAAPSTTPTGAP